jgi:hypothetical protein
MTAHKEVGEPIEEKPLAQTAVVEVDPKPTSPVDQYQPVSKA